MNEWASTGKKHLIGPTELLAVVVARATWQRWLDTQRAIFFIDHAGVLAAGIKGKARDQEWRRLLLALEKADEHPCLAWYTRVPSPSNAADPPSRGSVDFPVKGFLTTRDSPNCPFTGLALPAYEMGK